MLFRICSPSLPLATAAPENLLVDNKKSSSSAESF